MPGLPPFVVDDETKTELEDATFLLSLADFPGDDLSWFPSSHGPATCDQALRAATCRQDWSGTCRWGEARSSKFTGEICGEAETEESRNEGHDLRLVHTIERAELRLCLSARCGEARRSDRIPRAADRRPPLGQAFQVADSRRESHDALTDEN